MPALVHAWPARQAIGLVAVFPPGGSVDRLSHILAQALQPDLPFDARKYLAPVALVGTGAMVLATHADSPCGNLADVPAAARAKKNVSQGSIGSGSLGQLSMALLATNDDLDLLHVPCRGLAR